MTTESGFSLPKFIILIALAACILTLGVTAYTLLNNKSEQKNFTYITDPKELFEDLTIEPLKSLGTSKASDDKCTLKAYLFSAQTGNSTDFSGFVNGRETRVKRQLCDTYNPKESTASARASFKPEKISQLNVFKCSQEYVDYSMYCSNLITGTVQEIDTNLVQLTDTRNQNLYLILPKDSTVSVLDNKLNLIKTAQISNFSELGLEKGQTVAFRYGNDKNLSTSKVKRGSKMFPVGLVYIDKNYLGEVYIIR